MSGRGGSSRHRGRELALQTLYAVDLEMRRVVRSVDSSSDADGGKLAARPPAGVVSEADARRVFDGIAANFEAPPGAQEFAWSLVSEVCARVVELDEQIAKRARNWRISRMAAVDRNVLRLGAFELAHTATPAAVVMDEAVELARRYGTDASPGFVNGILDALAGETS